MAASVFGRRARLRAIGLTAFALSAMASGMALAQSHDRAAIQAQVAKRHDTAVKALHVHEGSRYEAELKNGVHLPVGRTRFKQIREMLS